VFSDVTRKQLLNMCAQHGSHMNEAVRCFRLLATGFFYGVVLIDSARIACVMICGCGGLPEPRMHGRRSADPLLRWILASCRGIWVSNRPPE
jgi:hypothetical protein